MIILRKNCKLCNKEFDGGKQKLYCSDECSKEFRVKSVPSKEYGIGTSSVGTMGELMVSTDLLKMGYQVFRNLSPTGKYDIVVETEDGLIGIDVKTGYIHNVTKELVLKAKCRSERLAFVIHETKQIVYVPELPNPVAHYTN